MNPHVDYVLHLADNALILGQRLSQWCGHAPVLEEDLALANMALDLIGQARALLAHAGQLEGAGRDEDALAFLRDAGAYRNVTLVELPNGDFACTVIRNLLMSAFSLQVCAALAGSCDATLAQIAGKSAAELRYHLRHAADWTMRLGDGTEESHQRAQAALDALWPHTAELFDPDESERAAQRLGIGVAPDVLREGWLAAVEPVLTEAGLQHAAMPASAAGRGKRGVHSPAFAALLHEMQHLQRLHPGARW